MWLTPRDLTKDPAILKLLRYWPPQTAMVRDDTASSGVVASDLSGCRPSTLADLAFRCNLSSLLAQRRSRRTPENATPQQKRSTPSPTPSEMDRREKEAHRRLLLETEDAMYVDGHEAALHAASSAAHDLPSMRASSVQPSMRSMRSARSARDGSVRSARSSREQIDKGMGQLVKLQKTQVFVTAITAFLFLFRQAAGQAR